MTQQNPLAPAGGADEFEIMRQRLKQRGAARGEQAQRGVARQAASLGNLPSGAALKQRQFAAQATDAQTGQELQDVNVLQAQTQRAERESAAARELQRFGITEGSRIASRGQDIQRFGIEEQSRLGERGQDITKFGIESQAATAKEGFAVQRYGIDEQTRVSILGQEATTAIAERGYETDLEKTALDNASAMALMEKQGASAIELQEAKFKFDKVLQDKQIQADSNAALMVERGMDRRLAKTISSNINLQKMADKMAQKGIDVQQQLADIAQTTAEQEAVLNQAATIINSFDPLRNLGFDNAAIADLLETLDMPFAEEMVEMFGEISTTAAASKLFDNVDLSGGSLAGNGSGGQVVIDPQTGSNKFVPAGDPGNL